LEEKVDSMLRETRSIWEQVLSRLTSIEECQERMEQRQERMEQRQESMDRRLRWIYDEFKDQKMRLRPVFNDVTKLVNNYDDFEERLLKLETEHTP
jgi:chromosome segregation ATPase